MGFSIVVAAIVLVMTVTSLGAFYFLRRHKGLELEQALPTAAWAGLTPFFVIAIVAFKLFILAMVIALIPAAVGFRSFDGSFPDNLVSYGFSSGDNGGGDCRKIRSWPILRSRLGGLAYDAVDCGVLRRHVLPGVRWYWRTLVFAAIAGVKALVLG